MESDYYTLDDKRKKLEKPWGFGADIVQKFNNETVN
jgi:hypothetical protein